MKKIIAIIAILFLTSTVMAAGTKEPTAPKTTKSKVTKTSTKKDATASKCQATTLAGKPCSRNAANGGKYCTQHAKMKKKG